MRAVEAIRRANLPRPPEHSVRLRAACLGAVLVAIAACESMGEVSLTTAAVAMALVTLGMAFSLVTRSHPPGWVKIVVAVGALVASVRFFHSLSAPSGGIATVEDPLVVLLVSVLVLHSFHVPARRDLMFSLGASAGLMAVEGAQAIDLRFGLYVVAWAALSFWGLLEMWASASGGGRLPAGGLAAALVAVTAAAVAIFLVLPAPTVSSRVNFLAKAGIGGSIGTPGALAGDSGSPTQLAQAGSRNGPTRIGGYLGFAGSLDTALRGKLGDSVVMLVRAQRPSYWVGETFDDWNGQSWTETAATRPLREQSPFDLPLPEGEVPLGQPDLQTFYVTSSTADLVFHAESASLLWFPTSKIYFSSDGTVVSPIGLGSGSIYTVESQVSSPTPAELRRMPSGVSLPPTLEKSYLQLPHPYPRVRALALSITAGETNNYDRVESLISWIGRHTRYSTDIPQLPAGADTVDEFLFGNRVGFCEQISTSLAVMLRSIGIPARETVGYVPGSYNPITDLYEVRADDAHAWVQVWFPGLGWQDFDPTAVVPLANPSPGATALKDVAAALDHAPLIPLAAVVLGVGLTAVIVRRRRSRPATWAERVARDAERYGRRVGQPRRPHETLIAYAALLDHGAEGGGSGWSPLASAAEASAYGGRQPSRQDQRALLAASRHIRRRRRGVRRSRRSRFQARESRRGSPISK